MFQFWGLGALFGGLIPPMPPRGDGTGPRQLPSSPNGSAGNAYISYKFYAVYHQKGDF